MPRFDTSQRIEEARRVRATSLDLTRRVLRALPPEIGNKIAALAFQWDDYSPAAAHSGHFLSLQNRHRMAAQPSGGVGYPSPQYPAALMGRGNKKPDAVTGSRASPPTSWARYTSRLRLGGGCTTRIAPCSGA